MSVICVKLYLYQKYVRYMQYKKGDKLSVVDKKKNSLECILIGVTERAVGYTLHLANGIFKFSINLDSNFKSNDFIVKTIGNI